MIFTKISLAALPDTLAESEGSPRAAKIIWLIRR